MTDWYEKVKETIEKNEERDPNFYKIAEEGKPNFYSELKNYYDNVLLNRASHPLSPKNDFEAVAIRGARSCVAAIIDQKYPNDEAAFKDITEEFEVHVRVKVIPRRIHGLEYR